MGGVPEIDYRLEECIITKESNEIDVKLSEVRWHYANQTMKVLLKYCYEKSGHIERYEWDDIPQETLEITTKNDILKLRKSIFNVAIFFSELEKYDITDKLYELKLERLNPFLDKIFAYAIVILLLTNDDFSDKKQNEELLRNNFKLVLETIKNMPITMQESDEKINDCESVNASKLEIGQVVKNYKEMCTILDEEELQGNSKKAQLKEWERYFLWEKKGQKFIILDVYETPLAKKDGRQNRNIYVQYIEVILMKLLSKQKNNGYAFYITMNQLWKLLGMINNDYKKVSLEDLNNRITGYEVTSFDMKKFYQRCNQKLREILFSSLNNLQTRSLIKYELEVVIVSINKNNKTHYEVADDEQKRKILKAERQTLLDMGLESKRQVYAKMKDTEFFERLSSYLQEWYGWEYTYNRIKIIYNKPDIIDTVDKDEMKLKKSFNEIKLQRLGLNDKVVDALNKNALSMVENRRKKADEEYQIAIDNYLNEYSIIGNVPESFLPSKRKLKIFDYSPYFVEIQNRLTDELISLRKESKVKTIIEFNDDDQSDLDELF